METMLQQALALAPKVQAVISELLARNIGKEEMLRATFLSLVSSRPAFFLGSPGINKTGTVQDIARRIEGAIFYDALMPTIVSVEQLLVESTSIEELPTANGGKAIRTRDELGRAARAHILFADEIWKAETRVLQTVLDLAKGDGVRHEGQQTKTPLLAFIAASNELPEQDSGLGALWSRMTIRAVVGSLDTAGKKALVTARRTRDRARVKGEADQSAKLTLAEVEALRQARPFVEVPEEVIEQVLEIYQQLLNQDAASFQWLWDDDRRFGRIFDVLQAEALLHGRTTVTKQDLNVLEFLLWDTPEQIGAVKAMLAPFVRTPASEARELFDALMAPGGLVTEYMASRSEKAVDALKEVRECVTALDELASQAGEDTEAVKAVLAETRDLAERISLRFAGKL
ncbi:MAG TPA: AAA family ATPase [Patescibacteria group bacterium]|nr:AAA family ATPase [Patescibacteria group bacterium]